MFSFIFYSSSIHHMFFFKLLEIRTTPTKINKNRTNYTTTTTSAVVVVFLSVVAMLAGSADILASISNSPFTTTDESVHTGVVSVSAMLTDATSVSAGHPRRLSKLFINVPSPCLSLQDGSAFTVSMEATFSIMTRSGGSWQYMYYLIDNTSRQSSVTKLSKKIIASTV